MPFVAIGSLLVLLKLLEIDPVAGWSWVWILAPFAAAVVWWLYADSTGFTQRRAIKRMEDRKTERRERDIRALGLDVHADRRKRSRGDAGGGKKGGPGR